MAFEFDGILALEKMERAVLKVKERLLRSTGALERAGIPYAVVGGNAVGAWIEQVDESAVRSTQDVDLAIRREDLEAVKVALAAVGFIYSRGEPHDTFLDGPDAKTRDAVHVFMAGEKVRNDDLAAAPDLAEVTSFDSFLVMNLKSLVQMKLTSFRLKDRMHLRDLIGVGLVDATWPDRFAPELASRLQQLLDNPDG